MYQPVTGPATGEKRAQRPGPVAPPAIDEMVDLERVRRRPDDKPLFLVRRVAGRIGKCLVLIGDRWHVASRGFQRGHDTPTQVGRALAQLGIELIPAYSPEARGRSERMFGTLQKRLPQELRLAGITDMVEANRFLKEVFLPQHNARFATPAEDRGTAFVPFRYHADGQPIDSQTREAA